MHLKPILMICILFCIIFIILCLNYENQTLEKIFSVVNNINNLTISKKRPTIVNFGDIELEVTANCSVSYILWLVTSYVGNEKNRNIIRNSYSKEELQYLGVHRVFLLGKSDSISDVSIESKNFQDIVQGNFKEAYRNLTYKHLMGLEWAVENCAKISFIMKTDDDIVVDIYEVISLLKTKSEEMQKLNNIFVMGHILRNMKPIRDPQNKWFVTKSEFQKNIYPDFVSGWLYLTTPKAARKLTYQARKYSTYFWIDDVFVTGILREDSGLTIIDIHELFATDYRFLECCIDSGFKKKLKCDFIVGPDGARDQLFERYQKFAKFCQVNKCSKRQLTNTVAKTCISVYKESMTFNAPGSAFIRILKS